MPEVPTPSSCQRERLPGPGPTACSAPRTHWIRAGLSTFARLAKQGPVSDLNPASKLKRKEKAALGFPMFLLLNFSIYFWYSSHTSHSHWHESMACVSCPCLLVNIPPPRPALHSLTFSRLHLTWKSFPPHPSWSSPTRLPMPSSWSSAHLPGRSHQSPHPQPLQPPMSAHLFSFKFLRSGEQPHARVPLAPGWEYQFSMMFSLDAFPGFGPLFQVPGLFLPSENALLPLLYLCQ